jgi:predicted ATPase
LVSVLGPMGIGKTRLVAEAVGTGAVERVTCWCNLAGVSSTNEVIASIASGLDAPVDRGRLGLGQLATFLGSRSVLLVLDSAEDAVRRTDSVVEHLLSACPRLSVLVSSRVAPRLEGQAALWVPPLAVETDPAATQREMLEVPATALLRLRYLEAAGPSVLDERSIRRIAGLACLLDGVPLAIELLAPHLVANGLDATFPLDLDASYLEAPARAVGASSLPHARRAAICDAASWSGSRLRHADDVSPDASTSREIRSGSRQASRH